MTLFDSVKRNISSRENKGAALVRNAEGVITNALETMSKGTGEKILNPAGEAEPPHSYQVK